jgi:hypothetical protein
MRSEINMQQAPMTTHGFRSQHALLLLTIALITATALVGFFLRGGWGLGLTLAIFAAEAGLWLFYLVDRDAFKSVVVQGSSTNVPAGQSTARRSPQLNQLQLFQLALTLSILILGSTYTVFSNEMLHVLDFPVIFYLFIVQSILLFGSSDRDWDEPLFWIESGLAMFVRPFASLGKLGWMIDRALGRPTSATTDGSAASQQPGATAADQKPDATSTVSSVGIAGPKPFRLVGQILLGLLLAIPVLLLTGSLLASADSVFNQFLSGFSQYWQNLSIQDRLVDIGLTLLLFPFIFSYLESCRSRFQVLPRRAATTELLTGQPALSHRERQLKLNPVTLITFLTCINLMYLAFAVVQATYLTGAFRFVLPNGLSYAEYARKGFFELAGITPINVALIVLAVKSAGRKGLAGTILRSQSLLLLAGSLVQWCSAMFRMQMYISVYALTMMRFFVSAFMILMLVLYILLTIKEFHIKFPLFKASAIAAVLSLVLLNAVNADAIIAHYNIRQMAAHPAQTFDLEYYRELSADALPILVDALPEFDPSQQAAVQSHLDQRAQSLIDSSTNERWQNYNWSQNWALRKLATVESGLAQ